MTTSPKLQFVPPKPRKKGGRPPDGERAMTSTERGRAFAARLKRQSGRILKVALTAHDETNLARVREMGGYTEDADAMRAALRSFFYRLKRGSPVDGE
jgi:DNA topoisomerase IA